MRVTCRAERCLWWSVAEILRKLLCKNQNKDQNNKLMAMGMLSEHAVRMEQEKYLSFAASYLLIILIVKYNLPIE